MIPISGCRDIVKNVLFCDILEIRQPRFLDQSKFLLAEVAKNGLHHRVESKTLRYWRSFSGATGNTRGKILAAVLL